MSSHAPSSLRGILRRTAASSSSQPDNQDTSFAGASGLEAGSIEMTGGAAERPSFLLASDKIYEEAKRYVQFHATKNSSADVRSTNQLDERSSAGQLASDKAVLDRDVEDYSIAHSLLGYNYMNNFHTLSDSFERFLKVLRNVPRDRPESTVQDLKNDKPTKVVNKLQRARAVRAELENGFSTQNVRALTDMVSAIKRLHPKWDDSTDSPVPTYKLLPTLARKLICSRGTVLRGRQGAQGGGWGPLGRDVHIVMQRSVMSRQSHP